MKSRCAPSGKKLETRKKLAFLFSPVPLLVPTEYVTTSWPVEVARSSGVSVRWPTMVIFAKELDRWVVLKARRERGAAVRRRANMFAVAVAGGLWMMVGSG